MKTSFVFVLFILLVLPAQAQNNYTQAIQQGDAALRRGEYKTAMKKYFAAEGFDPSKKAVVQRKVEVAFDKIETLRVEAERAFKQVKAEQEKTQKALTQVQEEQEKTKQALDKANKLLKMFYFYADRFALANLDGLYYFIDKNGNRVQKLGHWGSVTQFDNDGFAYGSPCKSDTVATFDPDTYTEHVRIYREFTDDLYVLDTTGRTYLFSTDSLEKQSDIAAIKLSDAKLGTLPDSLFDNLNLELLWLDGNKLESLPPQIGKLKNLKWLDLSNNKLTTLPVEIWDLENLKVLILANNELAELPKEIGNLNKLEVLNLSGTHLVTFPEELGNLKNLKILDVATGISPLHNLATIEQLLPNCKIITDFDDGDMSLFLEEMSHDYPQAFYFQKKVVNQYSTIDRHWFRLSWLALFVNKPEEAIQAAQKTLGLNPQALSVETNLALGYLLNNQWPEAEKIYLKWKGKTFPNDKRTCDTIFLKDIAKLEAANISHPDFEKVKQLFKK